MSEITYLSNVKSNNVIPTWASLDEGALYVIESTERDFTNMMKSIGISELAIAESGDILSEAGGVKEKIKGIVDSIVTWLKNTWAKIKGLFNKALEFFQNKIDEFHNKVADSRLKKIPDKLKKLKDKEYGKTYTYNTYDDLLAFKGYICDAIKELNDTIDSKLADYIDSGEDGDLTKLVEDCESAKKKFYTRIGVSDGAKDSAVKEKIKEHIRGQEVVINKRYIESNWQDMVTNCRDYGRKKREFKASFNTTQKNFDKTIKTLKKNYKGSNPDLLSKFLPYIKFAKNMNTVACGTILSTAREKMMKDMSIVLRLSMLVGKDVEEKEEVSNESSTFQTELASLFNWSI